MPYFDDLKKYRWKGRRGTASHKRAIVQDIVAPSAGEALRLSNQHSPTLMDADESPRQEPEELPQIETSRPSKAADIQTVPSRDAASASPALNVEPMPAVRRWWPQTASVRLKRRAVIAAISMAAAAVIAVPTFAVPRFAVTLEPRVYSAGVAETEIIADTKLSAPDRAARRIPAIAITVEKTLAGEYEATASAVVRERASGTVTLSNAFSARPQVLVAQTRLTDPAGRIFRLQKAVTIPGATAKGDELIAASVLVEVTADQPGNEYNIAPTEFRIVGFRGTPRYEGFYGASNQPFNGGFTGEARVVSSQDLAKASEDLSRRVVEELNRELEAKIPGGSDFLIPNGAQTVEIVNIQQPKKEERAERFVSRASARGSLIAVRRSHLAETLLATALPEVAGEHPAKPLARQDQLLVAARPKGGRETRLSASGSVAYYLEPDVEAIGAVIRASTPKKVQDYLAAREEIGSFRIKRFPRWLWFVPADDRRIQVSIQRPG